MNRLAKGLGLVLTVAICAGVWGQDKAAPTEKPARVEDDRPITTLYLQNVSQINDGNEILTALRLMLDPSVKLYLTPSQNSITLRATPRQLAEAKEILSELDRPSKLYRLTYTVEEQDGGKRVGVQHFSIVLATGAKTTLKQGSRVPIQTGHYDMDAKTQQTQFTYLDIGLNVEATLGEFEGGVRLRSLLEQSSLAPERSGVGDGDPIVRQTRLEGTALLTVGKTVALGSLDVPGSTRHLEVSVVVEPVK